MADRGTAGQIYNVRSTEPITILELAEKILRLTGSSSEIVFVPYDQVYGQGIEEIFQRIHRRRGSGKRSAGSRSCRSTRSSER